MVVYKDLETLNNEEEIKNFKGKKLFALMLFNTEIELGISSTPEKWVNTRTLVFTNGTQALMAYSEIPNPASQLVDGKTPQELAEQIEQMRENFNNPAWLEENLYPYL